MDRLILIILSLLSALMSGYGVPVAGADPYKLVYEWSAGTAPTAANADAVSHLLQARCEAAGVTGAKITTEMILRRFVVDIPDASEIADIDAFAQMLGKTGRLTFQDESGNILLDGSDIADAYKTVTNRNGINCIEIALIFTADGAVKFGQITQDLIGEQLAIYLDDELLVAPTVNAPIYDGNAVITGNFTDEQATNLVALMKAGALPFALTPVSCEPYSSS